MMGAYGPNYGGNFEAVAVEIIPVSAIKTVTAELCVNTSTKNDLCTNNSIKADLCV